MVASKQEGGPGGLESDGPRFESWLSDMHQLADSGQVTDLSMCPLLGITHHKGVII